MAHEGFVVPTSWNALTGDLAYYDHRTFEIWIRTADGTTRRFLDGPGRKRSGRFSPDGKWLAFVSDETGDYQVYVTAYPGPGATVTVSTKSVSRCRPSSLKGRQCPTRMQVAPADEAGCRLAGRPSVSVGFFHCRP